MTKVRILEKTWKVSVLSSDAFVRRFKEYCAGLTIPDTLEIVICEDELTVKTVRHELWHAYMDGLNLSSACLTLDQQEEVSAELVAEHGPALLRKASLLYKHLKEELE